MKVRAIIVDGPADPGTLAELRRAIDAPELKVINTWNRPGIMVSEIVEQVAFEMGLKTIDVLGHHRHRPLVRARAAICWLARRLTRRSIADIGRALWYVDHTTVLHHLKRSELLRDEDAAFRALTDKVLLHFAEGRP